MASSNSTSAYESWTREELVQRLQQLESAQKKGSQSEAISGSQKTMPAEKKKFDFSAYETRKIALKFCYSGSEYGGLAFQNTPTPLPTVEGVLFDALAHAKLIDGNAGLEGCGWERCGRTDRGVSAGGQVVSLYVRSAKKKESSTPHSDTSDTSVQDAPNLSSSDTVPAPGQDDIFSSYDLDTSKPSNNSAQKVKVHRELPYVWTLNHLLPPTIRILAWSPVSAEFSARFNCAHRHYKYFFPSTGLSIPRMQEAAALLVGEHDFRNLCKLDPAKQIKSFKRRILQATISPVNEGEDMFVLDLVGTAFLYHQVRHIMAVLLLIGSGLEPPSLIPALMNVDGCSGDLPVVDRKPEYQMADALPLMLWDCAFRENDVQWQDGDGGPLGKGYLHTQLRSTWERSRIQGALDQHFLLAAEQFHAPEKSHLPLRPEDLVISSASGKPFPSLPRIEKSQNSVTYAVPLGGGTFRRSTAYVPTLERKRLEHVDVVNERWLNTKGARKAAARAESDVAEDE